MAVRAERDLVCLRHSRPDGREELAHIVGRREADGVRKVDCRCACVNDRLHHTAEEFHVAARGVLRRKLHVVGVLARKANCIHRSLQTLLPAHPELRLQVKIGRRDEGMNAALRSRAIDHAAFPDPRDGTGPARDDRPTDFCGDAANGFRVGR